MSVTDKAHHSECPCCDADLLGFTDSDMVVHFLEEHPESIETVAEWIGIDRKHREVCDNCKREYITHNGSCPFCRHGGGPYK